MRTLRVVPALAAVILVSSLLTGCMSYIAGNQQNYIGNNERAQASSASSRLDRHDSHKHSQSDKCKTLDCLVRRTSGDNR